MYTLLSFWVPIYYILSKSCVQPLYRSEIASSMYFNKLFFSILENYFNTRLTKTFKCKYVNYEITKKFPKNR